MTRLVSVRIACNSCGVERQGRPGDLDEFTALAQLRHALAGVGWLCDQVADHDACPSCLANGEAPLP